MKRGHSKSSEEKPGIELGLKLNGKVVFTKATVKSLTMLDTIGLVALMMFPHALFHGMQIESDNHLPKQNIRDNND